MGYLEHKLGKMLQAMLEDKDDWFANLLIDAGTETFISDALVKHTVDMVLHLGVDGLERGLRKSLKYGKVEEILRALERKDALAPREKKALYILRQAL